MLRKYTRANSKLFGLRFHRPLFSLRTSSSWELEDPAVSFDPKERALVDKSHFAQSKLDFGAARRLRRRRRETNS